jgi:hypothetical protein
VTLRLAFGDTEVNVNTTTTLSRLLAATHRRHWHTATKTGGGKHSHRTIVVEIAPPDCSPELALRGAHREIAGEVAALHGWHAANAVVVERDGRALAIVGSAGSGKSTIAAHLVSRGWRLVSDDIAFIDDQRSTVVAHQGLMTFRSGAIPHLPASFRATLERSRWFVDERGELQFYEVDPANVFGAEAWAGTAVLDALLVIDGGAGGRGVETISAEHSALHGIDGSAIPLETFTNLRVGVIRKDRATRMADHIERWYDAHVGA